MFKILHFYKWLNHINFFLTSTTLDMKTNDYYHSLIFNGNYRFLFLKSNSHSIYSFTIIKRTKMENI